MSRVPASATKHTHGFPFESVDLPGLGCELRARMARRRRLWFLISALFGAYFKQPLGHQDESENLRPLRNNVADNLSPPAARIHRPECHHPANACNKKEHGERVLTQQLHYSRW